MPWCRSVKVIILYAFFSALLDKITERLLRMIHNKTVNKNYALA